jgi:hypothetical protein
MEFNGQVIYTLSIIQFKSSKIIQYIHTLKIKEGYLVVNSKLKIGPSSSVKVGMMAIL